MATHIKNSIQELLDKKYTNAWQIDILRNIDSIFGNLKSKVQIEKISNDFIVLGVYDSCWMHELYLLSNLIINKINSKLDQPRIKYIRFKQVKGKKPNNSIGNDICLIENKIKTVELSSKEMHALDKIKDEQLNIALKNFLIKCYQHKN